MVEKDFWDLTAVPKSLSCRTGLQRKWDWEEHTAALQTALPGRLELPVLQTQNLTLTIALGLPTTWSQLNLWLLSECESLSDLNGSRQRKGDCRALSYFLTLTSQASWNVTRRSSWETESCPRWCLYHQAERSHEPSLFCWSRSGFLWGFIFFHFYFL